MKIYQNKPLISCILTSYNRPKLIQDAIRSILSQSYPYFELIIADDNSKQETKDTISKYLVDPRIRFFSTNVKDEDRLKKCRYSVTINLALKKYVTGDLICYLCDDDFYYPDRFERIITFFEINPKAKVVYTAQKVVNIEIKNNIIIKHSDFIRPAGITSQKALKKANWIDQNTLTHSRKCIDVLLKKGEGLWDESPKATHTGDWYFWLKLSKHFHFHAIPIITCEKRQHNKCIQRQQLKKQYNTKAVSELRE